MVTNYINTYRDCVAIQLGGIMTLLAQLISSYTFIQVLAILIVIYIMYIIYLKLTDDDYYSDLQEIKSQHKARLWSYVSGELKIIESTALQNSAKILKLDDPETSPDHQRQYDMFGLIVERTLNSNLFEEIKTAVRINGFHDMKGDELNVYIEDKSAVLLSNSRSYINQRSNYYPLLRGTDDERFPPELATKFYGKIVRKAIKISNDQKEEVKKLKQKYSFWAKINFIGNLYKKLKK